MKRLLFTLLGDVSFFSLGHFPCYTRKICLVFAQYPHGYTVGYLPACPPAASFIYLFIFIWFCCK